MYYAYPSLLTNPQTGVNNSSSTKVNGSNELGDLRKLEAISYPDLDDNPATNVSKPKSSESKENFVNSYIPDVPTKTNSSERNSNIYASNSTIVHDVPKNVGIVPVDRSTKPIRTISGQKIANGTAIVNIATPGSNHSSDVVNHAEKTDTKVQEYSQALDSAIKSAKDVLSKEKEVDDLTEKLNSASVNEELVNKLREKELEIDGFRKRAEDRNEEMVSSYSISLSLYTRLHLLNL